MSNNWLLYTLIFATGYGLAWLHICLLALLDPDREVNQTEKEI